MGLLSKMFGRDKESSSAVAEVPPCPHTALVARWDSVDDMGHEEKASSFQCHGCNESFSREEGLRLREEEAERVKKTLAT